MRVLRATRKSVGELSQTLGNLINGSSMNQQALLLPEHIPRCRFCGVTCRCLAYKSKVQGQLTALQQSLRCHLKPPSGRRAGVRLRERCLSSCLQSYNQPLPLFGDCGLQSPTFLQVVFRWSSPCPVAGCQSAPPAMSEPYKNEQLIRIR